MTTTPSDTRRLSAAKLALLERRLRGQGGNGTGGIPRRPDGEPVPLPPAQHSLWVVDQVLADNAVYSVHREWWLRGSLNTDALRRSLDELVRRHEILRTTYVDSGDNQPVQVIGPDRGAAFRLVDLTGVPEGQSQERAVALAEAELRQPFDLATGPIFRVTLFRVATEEHLLLLNVHHLACDGWSCAVLGRELDELYSAYALGMSPALPVPELQYADYAHWQANRVRGELRDRQLDYWRSALAGIRPVLPLPTDLPYPAEASHRAGRVSRTVPATLTAAVRDLARARGATLFTTLLAAFGVVLLKCSGQDTFAIGSLTSGRERADVQNLIGLFANTVPIPADLSGDPSFTELLGRAQQAVFGALDHQDVSFEQIVTAVAPVREPARNPLFQVLFQLIEQSEENWRFAGLVAEHANLSNDSGKVDLALFAVDLGYEVKLHVEYSTDLFLPGTATRFAERIVRVLESVVAEPDTRMSDVDILSEQERIAVTSGWNDTAMEYPRATLPDLFEAAVRRTPDAVAVVDAGGVPVGYAELDAMANRLAHHLRGLGVGPESVVGVCVEHSVDMFVALLGVLKSGAAYLPLDPEHPADRLAFMLADTGAPVVVTQDRVVAAVPGEFDGVLVSLDADAGLLAGLPRTDPVSECGPDNLVYVMYTSGSTGRPKGVMISHAALVNYLWWAIDGYGLGGASGAPMLGSIAFDLSVPNFFLPLIGGKDVTLLPKDKSLSALVDLLRGRGDFSLLKLTPGHLDVLRGMLSESDRVDCVRTFVVGADEVRPETVAAWRKVAPNARIIDEYGPTETVVGCSTYLVSDDFDPSVPVSIGRPIANIRMYVLDERLRPAPVGVAGELFIGGAGVARGYLNRPGLTAEKFVPDLFAGEPGARMYRTGDLARFRADGNLDFLGRIDHQVKILGYRIELGEIEARLLLHEQVSEAVVVARQDTPGHKRLAAYVVPVAGARPDVDELRVFLARSLPTYMVPRAWLVLDRMPLTQAGKVDRKALPDPDSAGPAAGTRYQAPTTPTEAGLAEIWAGVLGVDRVGVHDDFFDLGGDSILAIQITARARRAGLAATVRQVFEHRTVAALAAAVGGAAAVPVRADQHTLFGPVALTPMLRWFAGQPVRHDHYNQSVVLDCRPAVRPDVLERALAAVVDHHDALRLRLFGADTGWHAEIVAAQPGPLLRVVDLSDLTVPHRREVRERVGHEVHKGLSLTGGPLVAAALFTGDDRDAELLIAIHHVAVDAVSWNILLEDLATACRQLEAGEQVTLPAKSTSFQYWAQRLTHHADSAEFAEESAYWAKPAPAPAAIPVDHDHGPNTEASTQVVEVTLPEELTGVLLHQVPAAYRTEINDVLLAALARTVTEWAGGDSALVELEGHGREPLFDDVDVSRTVGWFTSVLPVELRLAAGGWGAQLKATKEQLRAVPRHGIGYGLARFLRADTAGVLAAAPAPLVSFNYLGRLDQQRGSAGGRFIDRAETLGANLDPHGERPHLIGVTAFVSANSLRLGWSYSANRHTDDTVRRLARRYLSHLTTLIDHCRSEQAGGATPSDFPLAGLDQETLDRLLAGLPGGARGVEDVYPLSPLQSGMLFRSMFDPESDDYFEQTGLIFRGELDVDMLAAAWQRVVDRHAVLRTIFRWDELPRPVQVVLRRHRVELDRLDWTGIDRAELPVRIERELREHRKARFDLAAECPYRLTVVTIGEDEHYLLWSLHHIVLDAWSVSSVLDEVLTAYQAAQGGGSAELPTVTPFRDYIAWIGGRNRVSDEDFWRAELAGLAEPTLLSGVPAVTGTAVQQVQRELPSDLAVRLRELAAGSRCTVGTVLQAAWALLLAGYTGSRDVMFGTVVAGRSADITGIDRMVGMLINTLPTRVTVDRDQPVAGYLTARQSKKLELREHEHCALADIQRHSAVPAGTPMFDTFFSYENFAGREIGGTALVAEPLRRDFEQTDCPLMFEVNHHDTIQIRTIYHGSVFDERTCRRILEHYEGILCDLVDRPQTPLGQLPALTALEQVRPDGSGGIDRNIRADGHDGETAAYVPPGNDVERALAETWTKVLGVTRVGVHDDFFELGGDSILAIQIVSHARRAGLSVTLPRVFQHRTVARLAQSIAGDTAVAVHADQHGISGAVVLTPMLRWFTEQPLSHDHYNQSVVLECRPAIHPDVLEHALTALIGHHDALRMRLSFAADRPNAEIAENHVEPLLRVVDLAGLPEHRRREIRARVGSEIQTGLSLSDGPVVAAALFTGDGWRSELMIAIHHAVVDTVSWNILLEDLATACQQLEAGQPVALPAKTTSFQYWAQRLTDHANSAELAGGPARPTLADIPCDHDNGPNIESSARVLTVRLPARLTDALVRQVPSAYRTEINDVLLTVLARTIAEWAGGDSAPVNLEGHGREPLFDDVDLSRTVGWFTTLFPVTLPASGGDWGDALKAVKEALRAVSNHGIEYGLARYLRGDLALAGTPAPRISFNYLGRLDQQRGTAGRFIELPDQLAGDRADWCQRPHLIDIDAAISGRRLQLRWVYSTARHDESTVRHLAERYLSRLGELIEHCVADTAGGATPSDFPLAGLDQESIDRLLAGAADPGRAREIEDVYPLSPLQSGMLFHVLGAADPEDYLVQKAYVSADALDVDALVGAWQAVVDRHAVLRTTFAWEGLPHPVQVVWRRRRIELDRLDWTGIDPAAVPGRIEEELHRQRRVGFDLARECPSRLTVISTAGGQHYLLWMLHHIVLDGWSAAAVLDEVLASCAGQVLALPPVVPFRDYLAWIAGRDRAADAEFWRAELAGLTAPALLSGMRASRRETGAGRVFGELPPELVERLRELAAHCRCTVGTVLQAAWALVLSGHTGASDVVFGTTVAGRAADIPGIERMIGMLINTLPTRVTVDPDQPVTEFISARQASQQALREREHCALADIQRWAPVPAGAALFDSVFLYENFAAGRPGARPAGVLDQLRPVDAPLGQTGQPLVLELNHHDHIATMLTYDRSRLGDAECALLLDHFEQLVVRMVDRPESTLGALLAEIPFQARLEAGTERAVVPPSTRVAPRTDAERTLAGVWAQVLGVAEIGVHEDFFDAGGNSILVFQVVALAQKAGLGVTVRQALRHRTIAELTASLRSDAAPAVIPDQPGEPAGVIPLTPTIQRFTELDVNHDHHNQSVLLTWRRPPSPDRLERALRAVLAHHEGPRLRLRREDGDWRLTTAEPADLERTEILRVVDLAAVTDQAGIVRAVAGELNTSLDLSHGPLVRAGLFLDTTGGQPTRLVIVAHQIAVDLVSWSILLDDLAAGYRQLDSGQPIALPPVATSYRRWATRLAEYAGTTQFTEQNAFWLARWPEAAPLPVDRPGGGNTESSERVAETVLPAELTEVLLRDAPTAFGCRMDEVLLSAVARALALWTGSDDVMVDLESHGREPLTDDLDLGRTVGWLSAVFPVRFHLPGPDDPVRRLTAVREQLRAVPQRGIGYGLVRCAGGARPGPQVSFTYHGQRFGQPVLDTDPLFEASTEALGDPRDPGGSRTHLLAVDAGVVAGQARIRWAYSAELHDPETIEQLSAHCLDEVRMLATRLDRCGAGPGGDLGRRLSERLFPNAPALIVPMARHRVPGAGVALIVGGELRSAWGEGTTGGEHSGPVLPTTLFQTGSVSKHLTTTGVLRLVQEGRLELDENVATYLTSWRLPEGPPVTLRQLLGHTAGLWSESSGHVEQPRGTIPDLRPILEGVLRDRPPGTGFRYANVHFSVVEQVVVDATGMPFPEVMRSRVIDPLGMTSSGFEHDFPESSVDRAAHGHLENGEPGQDGWPVAADVASSGLWTTPTDLAALELAILRAATGVRTGFLDRELALEMVTPAANGQYGLGTTASRGSGVHWFGHPGDRHSYQGFTAVDLYTGSGLVLLANIAGEAPLLANVISELGLGIHYRLRERGPA